MSKQTNISENLAKDASNNPIQIGNGFVTADASQSPQLSPLSLTGSVQTINVPRNAVEFIVFPSADMKISEDVAMASYDTITATTKESIPCAKMDKIYVQGSGTLKFRFTMVN